MRLRLLRCVVVTAAAVPVLLLLAQRRPNVSYTNLAQDRADREPVSVELSYETYPGDAKPHVATGFLKLQRADSLAAHARRISDLDKDPLPRV